MLKKVISGGQTGADQAGLCAATTAKIPTGGWAPHGWMTSRGPMPKLLIGYKMKEHTGGYRERTIQNIQDSDGTVVLSKNWNSRGTILTLNQTNFLGRHCLKVDLGRPFLRTVITDWIQEKEIETLNVAGNADRSGSDEIFYSVLDHLLNTFLYLKGEHKEADEKDK